MRVAVVGRAEIVEPFRAAGLSVHAVGPGEDAAAAVEALARSGAGIIFYTGDLAAELAGTVQHYSRRALPCLVMLPMGPGSGGMERLREIVKRAVGADVFAGAQAPGAGGGRTGNGVASDGR